jgi:hypothetical protein
MPHAEANPSDSPLATLLAPLATALDQAGVAADALVLVACNAGELLAQATSAALAATRALAPGAAEAIVMPTPAALGLTGPVLAPALAGRSAFQLGQVLLAQLAAHLPVDGVVGLGGRRYLRLGAAAPGTATQDFAMYCKTYRGDLDRAQVLVETWRRFNRDGLQLTLSCPTEDLPLFAPLAGGQVRLISDESFASDHLMPGPRTGYYNQQICKLNFFRTGLATNYVNLDSDTVFIRPFGADDFMHAPGIPYTVLVMDKDLSIERHYRHVHWVERQKVIAEIYAHFGLADRRLRTCHGAQVFNAGVLETLHTDFMRGKGWTYADMLQVAPYEFSWYNVWFQRCRQVPEYAVEPFFKILHMRPDYILSRLRMLREEDYAHAYVGLIMNSKWRPATPLRYADPDPAYARFYEAVMRDETVIERLQTV